MRICPTCRTAYPARGRATCAKDGTRLVDAEEYAASQRDPLLGQTVGGRFHVLERIGTGGMGMVYRAEQSGLGRPVALKVLKRELVSDRDTVARFHREAKAMSMLMHPNTVRVFDFGEDPEQGHLYLAMELLEGELLTAWIEREETPPVLEAVEVISEILRSLAEAHSKALIHRDLKPDNIFLARVDGSAAPVVKVLDFGIAKVFREEHRIDQLETQAGTVFGTPRYMSPEQAQGNNLDHRSDLYSVGVLLYQLLTGRPPFLDDDAVVVMAKHIREEPAAPRKLVPHQPVPRRLEKAVLRALAKEPDQRYENADAFELELHACIPDIEAEQDRIASGRPSGIIETVGELPRVPLFIGGGVVAIAMIFAVALVATSVPDEVAEAHDLTPAPSGIGAIAPPDVAAVPAPAPPTPSARVVELRSEPSGAEVWVDGEQRGVTPWRVELVEGTPVRVELRRERYQTTPVALDDTSGSVEDVVLTPAPRRQSSGRRRSHPQPPEGPSPTPEPSGPADAPEYERW